MCLQEAIFLTHIGENPNQQYGQWSIKKHFWTLHHCVQQDAKATAWHCYFNDLKARSQILKDFLLQHYDSFYKIKAYILEAKQSRALKL
jgi:hypothetical protein